MKSLVELFKIGRGPSSSHTMGPERACKIFMEQHPEINEFIGLKCGIEMTRARVVSIGGGSVSIESKSTVQTPDIYREYMFSDIASYCKTNPIRLWQYAVERENPDFWEYMNQVWNVMKRSIRCGLEDEGILPGRLSVKKKAKSLFLSQHIDESAETSEAGLAKIVL